ncbi:MAG: trypsin-like peptidase domain-containing protein [Microbacteriaceae bacterium]|nr:trypsin-like peptidase domain-containing protein [Microbacteriaceae bacterium]MCL2794173.1 trypsin-like peptidase domain-containing protein [Microbacteriaceae bacterium]
MSDNANDPVNPHETGTPAVEGAVQQPETAVPAAQEAPAPASPEAAASSSWEAPRPAPRFGEYAPQQPAPSQAPYPYATQPYPQGYAQQQAPQGYGQQPEQHTQPTQPVPGQHPYYAPFGAPQQTAQQPGQPKAEKPKREGSLSGRSIALIAAALVVGGLIGGGVGGGIAAAVAHNGGTPVSISGGSGAANVTVNDPNNATQVTAVAAKASNSVVTINVTAASQQESGTGSGVILSSDGYILTNTHVVTLDGDASSVTIQVQTNDGKLYSAKVVGTDPTDDLAVIKLDNASGLTPITWGSSSQLNVGDQVVAIGAPLGLQGTVTDGIVSALNRSVSLQSSAAPNGNSSSGGNSNSNPFGGFGGTNPFDQGQQSSQSTDISVPAIQTDAAINPGNSGGALLNDKGELIGINVAIASTGSSDGSTQSGNIGVGFAIPADLAHRIADELKANGKATHGLLGASVNNAAAQNNATTVGAVLEQISSGGAAQKAGLKVGDVVTNVDGVPVTSSTDLTAQIRAAAAGSTVKITYVRSGKTYQVSVTLGTYTPQQ